MGNLEKLETFPKLNIMASTRPDGTKAFSNAANGGEVFNFLKTELESLCQYLPLSLEWVPSSIKMASDASTSCIIIGRYRYGPERTYRLPNYYSGQISTDFHQSEYTLGPNNCSFAHKATFQFKLVVFFVLALEYWHSCLFTHFKIIFYYIINMVYMFSWHII